MSRFIPGEKVWTITSASGTELTLRLPDIRDLDILLEFINELADEDLYLPVSNRLTYDQELDYLLDLYRKCIKKDSIAVYAWDRDRFAGSSDVHRNTQDGERFAHMGTFGIALRKEYRGGGIGRKLAETTIEQATQRIPNLRMLQLDVYSENTNAYHLYKKLGFVESGRLPGAVKYQDRFLDKVVMTRSL